jgi:hypothetical protein
MSADRPRWRWGVVCASALIAVFFALALHESWWDRLGVFHMRPYFADTAAILAAGDAQRAGLDVYQPNPFDPFGRPHVYGPWWLVTAKLGLETADAWWVGAALALLFVGVTLLVFAPRTATGALVACLLLLSPPVLLGIERGNNDLVIFLVLVAAAALLARRAAWTGLAGAAALVLAAVLKFYPLVALAALLARPEKVSRLVATVAGSVLVFASLWWMQREGFFRALAIAPRPDTFLAYGIRLFPLVWERPGADLRWLSFGYLVGAVVAGVLLWRGRAALTRMIPDEGFVAALAVSGASCWLFCYLANNNYPYRAVLLLLAAPAWFALARSEEPASRTLGRGLCWLLLIALWSIAPRWWMLDAVRNAGPDFAQPIRYLLFIIGAEQVMILTISVALAAALAGWGWRRWNAIAVR